jgi:NAD(P)H-dependent flavin oxidoreductase YrpB (nitropropane dioxygenase family)
VAAVSEAGGLGMLALTWQNPEQARRSIRRTGELTIRPFGANLVLDFPVDDLLTVCPEERLPIILTVWGDPSPAHARIHQAGALRKATGSPLGGAGGPATGRTGEQHASSS